MGAKLNNLFVGLFAISFVVGPLNANLGKYSKYGSTVVLLRKDIAGVGATNKLEDFLKM